jgi:RNA polymerase sigma factor (sigma-70 family)
VSCKPADIGIEELLREHAPRVLGAVLRRFGEFDEAEDAVQEALLAAAMQWPEQGIPEHPRGWLIHVAGRRLIDRRRSDEARRRREDSVASRGSTQADGDDTLALLFMCCHPTLTPASAIALTLRAVGGLTTAQIARAFMVPEATMAQRISRAKQRIKTSGVGFAPPDREHWPGRLDAVLHVLYLIFNEGYTSSVGARLQQVELASEALRLTRAVHAAVPDHGEVAGLLALMLLTDARRAARTDADGELVALDEQDRSVWDRAAIAEGVGLITDAMAKGPVGPYQLQAAIAALHDEAASVEDTDWPQILALYQVLERLTRNPMVTLNRAVALAMVAGPRAGLALLDELAADERLAGHHRLESVRAHLLERAGEHEAAIACFVAAAAKTTSLPERRYLLGRAARLTG